MASVTRAWSIAACRAGPSSVDPSPSAPNTVLTLMSPVALLLCAADAGASSGGGGGGGAHLPRGHQQRQQQHERQQSLRHWHLRGRHRSCSPHAATSQSPGAARPHQPGLQQPGLVRPSSGRAVNLGIYGINPPRAEFSIGSTRIQCFKK
jgi:hypothetical protein